MENRIHLVHVSSNLESCSSKLFYPRIPENREYSENDSIERVCLSDSVEGSLSAMAEFPESNDDEKIEFDIWERSFNACDANIINYKELYEHSLVPDAMATHEYWYVNSPVKLYRRRCRLQNLAIARECKRSYLIIDPKYRKRIVKALSLNGIDENELSNLNACEIANEWLRAQKTSQQKRYEEIILNSTSIACNDPIEDCAKYYQLFKEPQPKRIVFDVTRLDIFDKLDISCAAES